MEKESPCQYVSAEYIICECGDNFPSEERLKIHLSTDHGHLEKPQEKSHKEKVGVVQQPPEYVTPQLFIFSGSGKPKPIKITKPLYILRTEDIKEEVVFENLPEEKITIPEILMNGESENPVTDEIKEEVKDDEVIELKLEEEEPQNEEDKPEIEEIAYIQEGDEVTYMKQVEFQIADPDQERVEYEEIQYEEVQYEEVGEESVEYETVVTGDQLMKEHNYNGEIKLTEFFCDVCGKSFPYEKSVNLHKRVHRPKDWVEPPSLIKKRHNKNVVCDVCGKKYASPAQLRYHQRVHTGEKPYACNYCPKRFTMPLFMQIHIRTHTGERPYQCPLCPKAFTNRAALLRHERVHTGVKPYPCPECGKCFSQSNSMKLHVRTVHLRLPAPYKSKARKLRDQRRAVMYKVGSKKVDPSKLTYEDDYNFDGDEKAVMFKVGSKKVDPSKLTYEDDYIYDGNKKSLMIKVGSRKVDPSKLTYEDDYNYNGDEKVVLTMENRTITLNTIRK